VAYSFQSIAFVASPAPEALAARERLVRYYGDADPEAADVIVALGGDGLMLQTLHRFLGRRKPIYGMNRGSVGFLMNEFSEMNLRDRLSAAELSRVHPLLMKASDVHGQSHETHAINEVYLFRQTHQTAKISISVDGRERLPELISDGVLVATPAGSTAYNYSANGPILPLNAHLLALTPISAFRPRRWRGAILPEQARVRFDVHEADKRPVSAVADHFETRNVCMVEVATDHSIDLLMLHDPGHSLDERILREQFGA
jgi:NAD+ kinase